MGILARLEGRPHNHGANNARSARAAGYAAAEVSRLTASLAAETQFINSTLRHQLRILRARSRQATQNNPFARRFVQMVVDNVCGPTPFRLQAKVKFQSGKLDTASNRRLEEEWQSWSRKGSCEITGRWSWAQMQRLIVRILATDGEVLLRRYRGPDFGRHGFVLQLIDVDRLDDLKNKSLPNGGAIHMGVEVDSTSRPVAYHILRRKPAQWESGSSLGRESDRIPGEDVLHLFVPEFADQVRGVPWMYAALLQLVHIGAFEEAAVIAARLGASQMGFIESPDGGKTLAEWSSGGPGADGQPMPPGDPQITAEPGAMPVLPPGYKFNAGWNPKYPDAAIEPFVKACLRGVAVGVNVAYHNLSGDMEGVNYSSARIAELDERDSWMTLQSFVVEHLHDDLYCDWLRQSVLMGALSFELAKLERYRAVYWQARRWAWVDPEKEVNAALKAIEGNLKSRTRIVAEQGEDIEDVFDEIAAEKQLASEKKIDLSMDKPAAAATATESADAQSQTEAKQRQMVVDAVREVVMSVPAPKEPSVNVTAPITVNVPERSVEVKTGDTHVTVPERELHFEATIPPAAAPVVHVNAYPECVEETIERDADREITRITRTATH